MLSLDTARVVVTGGAGFLGREVMTALDAAGVPGDHVTVIRRADYDLRDKAACRALYADLQPEVVIHLAASVGGIGINQENPGRFLYENLVMGVELVEEGRLFGKLKKFVGVGTVCAYPKFAPVPFREDDLWNGYPEETNAPYGLAKKMVLAQLQAYRQQYGFPGIYVIPVNLYGPGDNFDPRSSHVIAAIIRKVDEAQRAGRGWIDLWGDGSASREFLHVRDAARGIVLATERYENPDPVNLGTGSEITIKDLAERICRIMGFEGELRWDTTKPNGQPRRRLDTQRAKERFGFVAAIPLDEGLAETVAWWRAHHAEVEAAECAG